MDPGVSGWNPAQVSVPMIPPLFWKKRDDMLASGYRHRPTQTETSSEIPLENGDPGERSSSARICLPPRR
jgi:hypothetical protein